MPPWLPEHGWAEFKGERRLADSQIDLLRRWSEEGAPAGNLDDAPAAPLFSGEWQLGEPDLVIEPESAFDLPAVGRDVYFNFVMPIPLGQNRYVSGFELLPGSRAVHHAFVYIDPTPASRRREIAAGGNGFPGMSVPESACMPAGQFSSWNPGRAPHRETNGLFWMLRTNSDLVLQVHLNPQGKPDEIRPRLGLHFTNSPPTAEAYRMWLTTFLLDIPPSLSNYTAETVYTLPVDLDFLRVGAHAHYLCRKMESYAELPGGGRVWLLLINDWDFKWQGDYEYKTPVRLPRNSRVVMRFTYDNSTNNLRNPFSPPRRVIWGPQTTDEMGELMFQTLPRSAADYDLLFEDFRKFNAGLNVSYNRFRLRDNPADVDALIKLGRSLVALNRGAEAIPSFQQAVALSPTNDLPHFDLASVYLSQRRISRAFQEFKEVVRLNPEDGQAYEKLGVICHQMERFDEARAHFRKALLLDPGNAYAARYLQGLAPLKP